MFGSSSRRAIMKAGAVVGRVGGAASPPRAAGRAGAGGARWGHLCAHPSGDQRPRAEAQLDSRNFAFPVEVNPGRGAMLYLRVHGTQSHQGPFILWSERAFAKKTGKENLLFGMYYAGAITMIALNGI